LGARLLGSSKERHEHQLAVASVVEPLKKICTEVEPDAAPSLLRLANVQHLATGVRARVAADKSALDLAGLLHPTAAVCGAPTEEALDAIRRLERMRRGRYAGPVGWVDARGDGDWTIALRCGEFSGHRGRLFAGAGIVEGSAPESELEETRLKLKAMQSVLAS
jgi:menaquinone-specific isochorismate synthase